MHQSNPQLNITQSLFLNDFNAILKHYFNIHNKDKWREEGRETFLGRHKTEWEKWSWVEHCNRKIEVGMVRLRLGHTRLNAHMHRINSSDSPNCSHCKVPETV